MRYGVITRIHSKTRGKLDKDIMRKIYERWTDTAKQDLETFQSFLNRNIKNHLSCEKIRPNLNQPARLYVNARTHNFHNLHKVIVDKLTFRPLIDRTDTATYDTTNVIGEYLRPLAGNEYKINDCLKFPDTLIMLPP